MPTAKAGAQCRVPVPSRPPRHGGRQGRQGQARLMGAGEAGGGRRDRWGQARLVGAGEANGGRKPPGQIPSQHNFPHRGTLSHDFQGPTEIIIW